MGLIIIRGAEISEFSNRILKFEQISLDLIFFAKFKLIFKKSVTQDFWNLRVRLWIMLVPSTNQWSFLSLSSIVCFSTDYIRREYITNLI